MSRFPKEQQSGYRVVDQHSLAGVMGNGDAGLPVAVVADAVEQMGDFLLVADAGGRILYSNPSYRAWVGLEDVRGQILSELALFPEEAEDRKRAWDAVWARRPWKGSYWVQAPGESPARRYLATSLSPLAGGDQESCGFVVVSRDETEFHAAQTVARRLSNDKEFRRAVSFLHHEMANPLTTIVAVNSLLALEEDLGDDLGQSMEEMGKGVTQLRETLKHLRGSVESSSLRSRPVSVANVFLRAKAVVGGLAEEGQVQVDFVEPPPAAAGGGLAGGALMVLGDLEALTWVLVQLVENAVEQAVLQQKGTVTVTALEQRGSVLIEVEDSAGGMDPKHVADLFFAFFTTKGSGRGLGLTTARRLVTEMSGLIEARNNEVGGLSVTLRFGRP